MSDLEDTLPGTQVVEDEPDVLVIDMDGQSVSMFLPMGVEQSLEHRLEGRRFPGSEHNSLSCV